MRAIADTGTTGNFEIVVNGTLVWSKKTRGQGFFNKASDTDRQPVFDAIQKTKAFEYTLPTEASINSMHAPLLDDGTSYGQPKKKPGRMQLCCSLCTTIAAIPAIIGA